jgi:hypothetical protein
MLVHARAPLSPIGRRRVVDRVCEQAATESCSSGTAELPPPRAIGGAPALRPATPSPLRIATR